MDGRLALRVSLREKELWVSAAGGERRLSDWVRDRLNAAVTERGYEGQQKTPDVSASPVEVGASAAHPSSLRSVAAVFDSVPVSVVKGRCGHPNHGRLGWKCPGCREMF